MKALRAVAAAVVVAVLLSTATSVQAQYKGKGKFRSTCKLLVENRTPYRVMIHIDGVYWGWVNAHRNYTFFGVPGGKVALYGATQYGEFYWGPRGLLCEGAASWELSL
jgi:hypothetical protein